MAASNTPKKSPVNVRLPRRRSVSQICPPPRRPMTLAELYPGCENERLGVARESMLQNHLIAKPEVGKPRRSCYTLPGYGFNYGLYLRGTDGGVPEAICHWNAMKPRVVLEKEKPRDYKAMNSLAVKDGYITSHEHNLYRQAKDLRVDEVDERRFKRTPPKVPADMTYGRPARPSTPFFELLQHKYKEIWMDQQRAVIKAEKAEKHQKKRRGKTYETRTTLLRKHQPPMQPELLWHMPHFQKIGPHLSTFADQDSYKRAMEAFKSEIPVRIGPLAQGLYTSAS
ncbi:cilia- and flagella-associated protein 77 isoform X1 [Sceloporus undulatus]|uniref:cilia- and flagella-associated protein 77 isoform X1 n=1 Tax=Sceloporus undulatus TaxID=8520 RepID=UPI001C4D1707|nr:cilia- and flagella-associated protein 77 isoform X1 [Sceloporus undulatus]